MKATGRIPDGVVHRVLCTILVEVHVYDALGVRIVTLGKGRLFQPWQPLDHWRGKHVPITLGDDATQFDWGVTSWEGHFWDDFFERCAPRDVAD